MSNIFLNIPAETYQSLSESERYLLDYLHNHLESIPTMSIVKLSEEASVSTATIVRLMKKIGFDGYTSFKYDIKDQLHSAIYSDSIQQIDSKIKQAIKKNEIEVMNTISMLNIGTIEDAIQKMYAAEKIYIFSRGFSEMPATEMTVKLQITGKNCENHTDPNIIRLLSKRLQNKELAIFISLSGETAELVEACKNLKIKQVSTITITANAKSSLAQLSELTLHGFKSTLSFLPDYEVRSRLPLEVIARILLDAYIIRTT
ncbi:MurR/RpiR family transcriptional regulator [Brevibacillus daliensis]|uniref:MurR/RpiR family transcriptional regulator n=1 Tax=Brevibacillus daliensis TaxID=2892995 RepID=UPI001E4781A4|nr:MurR/RpiR family transcriptional regulator [Brevibacillus daliensis]